MSIFCSHLFAKNIVPYRQFLSKYYVTCTEKSIRKVMMMLKAIRAHESSKAAKKKAREVNETYYCFKKFKGRIDDTLTYMGSLA